MHNVAHQLGCIKATGFYHFCLSSQEIGDVEEVELVFHLETESSGQEKLDTGIQHSAKSSNLKLEKWKRDQIDDFVRKLGFLDSEVTDVKDIQQFLQQNEVSRVPQYPKIVMKVYIPIMEFLYAGCLQAHRSHSETP